MKAEQQKALEAADLNAFHDWEDGPGSYEVTVSGVWFAALAYERARVAALKEADELEKEKAQRWAWEMAQDHLAAVHEIWGFPAPAREPFPLDIKLTP